MNKNAIVFIMFFFMLLVFFNCERRYHSMVVTPESVNTLILGDTVNIAYKDTLTNDDENIWLTFDSLIADSRCPDGWVCFWEGNAEVSFIFNAIPFNLNTHLFFTTDTVIQDYYITLIDVRPYPHADSVYADDRYSADMLVSRITP